MALDNLSRKAPGRGRGGNNGPSTFNVFGMVTGYSVQPPKKGEKLDSTQDYMSVALFRDAGPLKSEQNPENGELLTVVQISLKPPGPIVDGGYIPLSIRDLQKGRHPARPMKEGDFVSFKDVEPVPGEPGKFKARRVDAGVREFNADEHYPYSGMVSVRRESFNERDGEKQFYQNRVVAMNDYAQTFDSQEDFVAKAVEAFQIADIHGCSQQVIIRAIQHDGSLTTEENGPDGAFDFALSREINLWDSKARQMISPEEAVANFVSGADGKNGPDIMAELGASPNYTFEVIPQFMYRTGKASLPSSKKADAVKNNRYKSGDDWKYDDSLASRVVSAEGKAESAYIGADVIMNRKPNEDPETNETRPWNRTHSIFFQEQRKFQGRFRQEELVTPNLPAGLVESLGKRADEARKVAVDADKALSNAPAKADSTAEQEQELEAGAPAPGMN